MNKTYMPKLIPTIGIALILAIVSPISFAHKQKDLYDEFKFFNSCNGVGLWIYEIGEEESEIGLTERSIRKLAKKRLRSARIYKPGMKYPMINVDVRVLDDAFSISLEYEKLLWDSITDSEFRAITWAI